MANWDIAFNWLMDSEDRNREYKQVPDASPAGWSGGPVYAISGINSAVFPQMFAAIAAVPQAKRGPGVESFYKGQFWFPWIDQLKDDELAKRVFDASVNMGPGTSVKLLQNSLGLHDDGLWGPVTLSNANDKPNAVQGFIAARVARYKAIVAAHPEDSVYLAGWLARASK